MKKFEHLNFEHRKIINNQITTHKTKAVDIANLIGCCELSLPSKIELVVSIHPGDILLALMVGPKLIASACVNAAIAPLALL